MSGTGTLCLPMSKTKKNDIFTDRYNFLVVAAQNKIHMAIVGHMLIK